jgi:hypothetical protein
MTWMTLGLLAGCPDPKTSSGPLVFSPPSETTPDPTSDCTQYEHNGQVYDCSTLDPCDLSSENIPARVACCNCDPLYCGTPDCTEDPPPTNTCQDCHGIEEAHPFAQADCVDCHGGDPEEADAERSHVPAPPELAHFLYLTRTGLEALPDYSVDGQVWTGLDYLQFLNPGDIRVAASGRGCGLSGCHEEHADWFETSPMSLGTGIYSTSLYAIGAPSATVDLYTSTAADYGFRNVEDPGWVYDESVVGPVGELLAFPERALLGDPTGIWQNPAYDALMLQPPQPDGRVEPGSPLQDLVASATLFLCSDCHAGTSGGLARTGQFRSGGCTSCHMPYASDGRYTGTDLTVPPGEPADPDALVPPERPHVRVHTLTVAPDDEACATCHSGTNQTALQYWGLRIDDNRAVALGFQYPANPFGWQTASERFQSSDTWLGRTEDQVLSFEDYDGDGRDDTPPDIHAERGMACIDCHGSRDLHGGTRWSDADLVTRTDLTSGQIVSRQDQHVGIRCTSCHGTVSSSPETVSCLDVVGVSADCVADAFGNPVRNVTVDAAGEVWLRSRLDGILHYVPQLQEIVVDTGALHPLSGAPLFSYNASFAMGTADGDPANGLGPVQQAEHLYTLGFTHLQNLACEACHASWTNACVGCHVEITYDDDPASELFSPSTGEPVTLRASGQVLYSSPVLAMLEVGTAGKVTLGQHGTGTFWSWTDRHGLRAGPFAFSDRNEQGNNPLLPGGAWQGALAHGRVMPHSIRGRVDAQNEGVKHCVACHLNLEQFDRQAEQYAEFLAGQLEPDVLAQQIGQNPGNQLNSPIYVHRMVGLGSGLFLLDADGQPVASAAEAAFDLDRVVQENGMPVGSWTRPSRDTNAMILRAGAHNSPLTGPLGPALLVQLADPNSGLVLDTWIDADGVLRP